MLQSEIVAHMRRNVELGDEDPSIDTTRSRTALEAFERRSDLSGFVPILEDELRTLREIAAGTAPAAIRRNQREAQLHAKQIEEWLAFIRTRKTAGGSPAA